MEKRGISVEEVFDIYHSSGFIYPEKKALLKPFIEEIRSNWVKLLSSDGIFRIFFDRTGEKVTSSVCALKYSSSTWLVQHATGIHNPLGVRNNLVQVTQSLVDDPKCRYGKFIFRPNNHWPRKIFTSLADRLGQQRCIKRTLDYYLGEIHSPLREVRLASNEEIHQVNEYLRLRLGEQVNDSEEFLQDEINALFEKAGLFRKRDIIVSRGDHGIEGFALTDFSSLGMNLSFYLNKAQVYVVRGNPLEIIFDLASQIKSYYASRGRSFAVVTSQVEDSFSSLLDPLGLRRVKEYWELTVTKSGGGLEEGIKHFIDYYQRIKNHFKEHGQ